MELPFASGCCKGQPGGYIQCTKVVMGSTEELMQKSSPVPLVASRL